MEPPNVRAANVASVLGSSSMRRRSKPCLRPHTARTRGKLPRAECLEAEEHVEWHTRGGEVYGIARRQIHLESQNGRRPRLPFPHQRQSSDASPSESLFR